MSERGSQVMTLFLIIRKMGIRTVERFPNDF